MPLAVLSIDIVAQIASLKEGLDKAGRLSEKTAAQIERNFASIRVGAAAVGTALAGAFAVPVLSAFVKNTAQSIDKLNDLKDATGASIENLSALEDVGLRTGTSFESVSSSLVKFNKALSDAKPGTDAARIFNALGLSLKELKAQDPAEALRRTAVALSQFADDGDKARAVQELFGRSVKEAAPFLNDLAKQTQLVATVTTEQAEAAERFNQQLTALSKNSTDLARTLTSGLLPVLNDYAEKLKEFLGGPKTKGTLGTELELVFSQLQKLKALRGEGFTIAGFFGSEADREKEIGKLEERLKRAQIAFSGQATGPGRRPANEGGGRFIPQLVLPPEDPSIKAPRKIRVARDAASELVGPQESEALKAALRAIDNVDSAKVAALREQLEALLSIRRARGGGAVDEAIAAVEEELQKLNPAAKAAADAQARLNDLLAATPSAKIAGLSDDMALLAKAFESGVVSADQFREAVQAAAGVGAQKDLKDTNDLARDLGLTFSSAFEDAIVSGQNLKGTLQGLADDIQRILARKLVTEPLADFTSGLIKQAPGFLSSLLASANGNVFGPGGVQAFARGGVVGGPTLFGFAGGTGLMGEAGPEAIVPLKRGRDGKLGVASAGGGESRALSLTVNVQAQPGMSRATATQQGAAIGAGIQRALARNG